jgi:hypothetical protein
MKTVLTIAVTLASVAVLSTSVSANNHQSAPFDPVQVRFPDRPKTPPQNVRSQPTQPTIRAPMRGPRR